MQDSNRKKGYGLSKSKYTAWLQCHKRLWLQVHRPDLLEQAEMPAEVFVGYQIGDLARGLFPGGALVEFDGQDISRQLALTQELLASKTPVIYEAAFDHEGLFCKTDLLVRKRDGFELYEVKASASVKDYHYNDLAVQVHILRGAGLKLKKAFLMHLNNQYIRQGELELDKLFNPVNLTDELGANLEKISAEAEKAREALAAGMPEIGIGSHCTDPYKCEFFDFCREHLPEYNVFGLCGSNALKARLYKQGILKLEEVPLNELSRNQQIQVECHISKDRHLEPENIKDFLNTLSYPLCFLDFETVQNAIPLYDGDWPYQQNPFQYSLHILEREGGKLIHKEFLAEHGKDPKPEFLKNLLRDLPEKGCVLAYNSSFEATRLRELAEIYPTHKVRIEKIIDSMINLATPFQKRWAYDWKQCGTYSIKEVLPAFIPDMSYDNLEIGNGDQAMKAYADLPGMTPEEVTSTRKALLVYCGQDTLAMVKLWEKLREMAEG
ncbi:MAG: DUF2779 domain-containing protein [Candidatus Wallbacteria bacterium]|nr:DUF2779 domain-containing protein [Candidatus Wallbacteria bacterium]